MLLFLLQLVVADGARVLAIWHLINKVKFSSTKCRVHIVVSTAKILWIRVYGYMDIHIFSGLTWLPLTYVRLTGYSSHVREVKYYMNVWFNVT